MYEDVRFFDVAIIAVERTARRFLAKLRNMPRLLEVAAFLAAAAFLVYWGVFGPA